VKTLLARPLSAALHMLMVCKILGQGTLVYDQQSVFDEATLGETASAIMAIQPMGQSFTPSLSSVGFIRLQLYGGNSGGGPGTTLYLNLRSSSITGPILGSTEGVFMPNGYFGGYVTFLFANPVPVSPGVMYFFQPMVQSGDWTVGTYNPYYNYPGGTVIARGMPNQASDLLFREGIIVPEPSSAALLLLACGALACVRRRRSPTSCS
jgi:hypothetical protein